MKNNICIVAALAVFAMLTSCQKTIDGLGVSIGMQSTTIDFVIPVTTTTKDTSFVAFNTSVNIDSIIRANSSFSSNNIKSAKLVSATLKLDNGDDANNFGNMEAYKLTFASNNKPDMIVVAQNDNNPDDGAQEIALPINTDQQLKDYFKATDFSYNLSGRLRRPTTKDLNCHVVIKYNIKVGL